jgi:hypothetical protein
MTSHEIIMAELEKMRTISSWTGAVQLWDLAIRVAEQAYASSAFQDALDQLPNGMPPQTRAAHLEGRLASMATQRALLALREAKTFAEHCQTYEGKT